MTVRGMNPRDILLEALEDLAVGKKVKFKLSHMGYGGTWSPHRGWFEEADGATTLAECMCKHWGSEVAVDGGGHPCPGRDQPEMWQLS